MFCFCPLSEAFDACWGFEWSVPDSEVGDLWDVIPSIYHHFCFRSRATEDCIVYLPNDICLKKKKNLPPFLQLIFNIYLSLSTFSCLWCRQLVPKQTNWGVSKHQPAGRLQLLTGSEDSPSSNELKKHLLGFFFFFLNLRLSTSLLMSQFNYLFKNVMVFTASRDYISSFY